tara:strand:+ start:644 stop:853 length:210 start_codon:yes stop_codon:yes gene_type:complete
LYLPHSNKLLIIDKIKIIDVGNKILKTSLFLYKLGKIRKLTKIDKAEEIKGRLNGPNVRQSKILRTIIK